MKMKRMTSLSKDVKTSLVKLRESATKMTYSPEEQKQIGKFFHLLFDIQDYREDLSWMVIRRNYANDPSCHR